MAGDWIKMRHCLPDEPEVIGMAHTLGVTPEHVCGCLLRVWGLGDTHAVSRSCPDATGTNEGLLSRYCPADIDKKAGQKGFADAMHAEGWLLIYPDGVAFPEWDEHHSSSAKARGCEQKKKRRQRKLSPNLSPVCPDATGTSSGPEKRRVDNNTPLTPQGGEVGVGELQTPTPDSNQNDPPPPADLASKTFETFWGLFPRKENQLGTIRKWRSILSNSPQPQALAASIIASVARWLPEWSKREPSKIPSPSMWLEDRRWADEPPAQTPKPKLSEEDEYIRHCDEQRRKAKREKMEREARERGAA